MARFYALFFFPTRKYPTTEKLAALSPELSDKLAREDGVLPRLEEETASLLSEGEPTP